jgi:hypothetical protein
MPGTVTPTPSTSESPCARACARAAEHAPVDEQSRPDARADGEEHGVARTLRCATPRLTEDVGGAIAVDHHRQVVAECGAQLVAQRIVIPPRDVRRPHRARRRAVDAGHRDADGVDVGEPLHARLRPCRRTPVGDERGHLGAAATVERHAVVVQRLARVVEHRRGELRPTEIHPDHRHFGAAGSRVDRRYARFAVPSMMCSFVE